MLQLLVPAWPGSLPLVQRASLQLFLAFYVLFASNTQN